MNTAAIDSHVQLIDDALLKLRHHLMGGSLPCLPPAVATTRKEQIRHITSTAAQITFCYAAINPTALPAEPRTCRTLICAILTYLLVGANRDEQTFDSILLLLAIERATLQRMLANQRCPHCLRHFLRNGIAALCGNNTLTGNIERAILLYLQQTDQLPDTYALRQQLRTLSL